MQTDDLRITKTHPLLTPALLSEEIPLTDTAGQVVTDGRRAVERILDGDDDRLLVVVGPCSIHDLTAAEEYAEKLLGLVEQVESKLLVVMRVYFEKPRTVIGWKGLINDPDLDGSYHINKGLRLARRLLVDIAEMGLPAGTEFLDTTLGQFYTDLISWGAIGARTAESQTHRELASGLSMPVGIKNRTDGDIQVAVDAIRSARHRHLFPSLTKAGMPAILETAGNPYCHLVLRGGRETGPNYSEQAVAAACERLAQAGLPEVVMVDCSHGNSEKDPARQAVVAAEVARQRAAGQTAIKAVMLESHLVAGRQDTGKGQLTYGQSITDACIGFEETADVLRRLAEG
ncbi:3-deoxy-7-phosphoheptulonate synthase [Aeoliella sp.]|uniref:3-deoxy-7-phosphoheptulonate synthase n=1 Tax=Aeoliella sp. TaxID=2795800 RepID=UPI003CCC10CB